MSDSTPKTAVPSAQQSNPDNSDNEIKQALGYCRKALISIGLFSFVINMLMLTGPLFMLQVYDRVLTSRSIPTLIALTVLIAGLFGFMGILEIIRSKVLVRIGLKLDSVLTERIFNIWLLQGLLKSDGKKTNPLADLATMRQFLSGNAPVALFDLPWVPFYLALVFLLHWTLGLVAVVGALIVFVLALTNELSTRNHLKRGAAHTAAAGAYADQSHRNAETVLAMGMGENVQKRWQQSHQEGIKNNITASDRAGTLTATSKTFRMFLQSIILAVGAALAVEQLITPGVMIAASILTGRALAPVDQTLAQWKGVITARQAYQRLKALLNSIPKEKDKTDLPDPEGKLSVEKVFVTPPGGSKPALKGVNFTLEPGQGLGVIGTSASGKSTLARLLIGAWLPMQGTVRLDGATLDQWKRVSLGKHIGYLPQQVELFSGTIKENIARFSPEAQDADVIEAAQRAGVHEMILRLANGYETEIGTDGAGLSGGQKQRIALARALYLDPALVILDEPNSNLDSEGDASLTEAIKGIRARGKTVIVMAHRPSAIAAVDMLLMLNDGQKTAFGPKEQVLKEVTQQVPNSQSSVQENPPQAGQTTPLGTAG